MKWRLDVELNNQSLYRVYKPSFLVEIDSRCKNERKSEFFETDYTVMQSIVEDLTNAVQSSWSVCCSDFRYLMQYA